MKTAPPSRCHPLGTHRVVEPPGVMPQEAWRLDNTPAATRSEILCDVEVLNIDSASFRQIAQACGLDAGRIGEHILENVRARGKQHNSVTGSGGMFVGHVLEVGEALRDKIDVRAGERIASLVSLSLTPLHIESIVDVDVKTHRVFVRGRAILFE
ncbi:MAG TPA: L-erythro-3,5-diaminohexanoate dehydrogenase, partial [Candidatus Cybelea sp.]|nr:L-erythro-3,5-diaminohexanoate dehydrogenase [Candidatus Cybelea sp.]